MKSVSTTWRLNCVKGLWREGIVAKPPAVVLSGEVECDELDVVAGHQGHPEAVKKRATRTPATLKGDRGRSTLAQERPPILGMIQRSGQVVMHLLANVQQVRTRRVRSRRWRRLPRSSRPHDGRLLVAVTILAATPPRHFAREAAALRRFLSVRSQRT
jgi:hypothetical protein